jgi:hypothetical protein
MVNPYLWLASLEDSNPSQTQYPKTAPCFFFFPWLTSKGLHCEGEARVNQAKSIGGPNSDEKRDEVRRLSLASFHAFNLWLAMLV